MAKVTQIKRSYRKTKVAKISKPKIKRTRRK